MFWLVFISFSKHIVLCGTGQSTSDEPCFCPRYSNQHAEPCGFEQHCSHGFWPRFIWPSRRDPVCVHGCLFLLRCSKWYISLRCYISLFIFVPLGSFFTSSRLVYAAGRERYLPAVFGKLHSSRRTPLNAALLQSAITIAFIMIGGGFRSLINFSVVASWAFYFLTVRNKLLGYYYDCHADSLPGIRPYNTTNQGAHARKVTKRRVIVIPPQLIDMKHADLIKHGSSPH